MPWEKGLDGNSGINIDFSRMTSIVNDYLPAEWHRQRMVQLTWPHRHTDWASMLTEVEECFTRIAAEVTRSEPLLIVAPDIEAVRARIEQEVNMQQVTFVKCDTNDTWARDHAFITLMSEGVPRLMDFCFNGWGEKFPATLDNAINRHIFDAGVVKGHYESHLDFVLEGGSIESDGAGTLLTTTCCLTAPHRNDMDKGALEQKFKSLFHLQQVLWLDHGSLIGDDTDGHIDTLARFCDTETIAYVQCTDPADEQYSELHAMEEQLATFTTVGGKPYRLIPLPLPAPIYHEGERLPATYANFLILNDALLYPTYGQPEADAEAGRRLALAFPHRRVTGVDCRPLIKQHGSLHCVTMQYPL